MCNYFRMKKMIDGEEGETESRSINEDYSSIIVTACLTRRLHNWVTP